jgi:hypothetical protein
MEGARLPDTQKQTNHSSQACKKTQITEKNDQTKMEMVMLCTA